MVKLASIILEFVLIFLPKFIKDAEKREMYNEAVGEALREKQTKAARQARLRTEAARVRQDARQKWRDRWGR
jgi:hypothetical protein